MLIGVLLPISFGAPNADVSFGRYLGEATLAISLVVMFANLLLMLAGHIGRRHREWWFAVAGMGLFVAHPMLGGVLDTPLDLGRHAIGALAVLVAAGRIETTRWPSRVGYLIGVVLAAVAIVGSLAALIVDSSASTGLAKAATVAFAGSAVALGGLALVYGQRHPDGALITFGTTVLAAGFGGVLLLRTSSDEVTVGVATICGVAAVLALTAAITALFEALARRETRREALVLSHGLTVARLEAEAARFKEITHDQRSTLLAIEAAAERMQTQPSGELAAAVASEAARLNRLLAGDGSPGTVFGLEEAILPMVECMRAFGNEIGLVVHDDVSVWGDLDEIVEIVGALVDNALTHGEAPIRIELGHAGDRAVLRVVDQGPGVPAPLRESVFERGVTTQPEDHSGLGLFSARRMIESGGGSLVIAADDGAFELTLPVERPAALPAPMEVLGVLREADGA